MKKSIILFFIIISVPNVFSQDLIVTLTDDSLNCKITQIDSEFIHFDIMYNEEVRSTVLMLSTIKNYKEKYYSKSNLPAQENSTMEYPRFLMFIRGGGSYLLDPISDDAEGDIREYYENLKIGYDLGFDVNYYFNKTIGLGLKYSYFSSSGSTEGTSSGNGGSSEWNISENIMINFVGPTFLARFLSAKNNNGFVLGASVGYMWYKDDAVLLDPVIITGSTLGLNIDASYNISISRIFFIGISASTTLGFLPSLTIDDGISEEIYEFESFGDYKNISRADISILFGFKF
jgi:hypothetical protein